MDLNKLQTAAEIVNYWPEKELADLIYRYGEERNSRKIARNMVRGRAIRDTEHLATVVAGPQSKGRQKTASRDKNISGAADCGESRVGGTRAVSSVEG